MSDGIDLVDVYEVQIELVGAGRAVADAAAAQAALEAALPEVYQIDLKLNGEQDIIRATKAIGDEEAAIGRLVRAMEEAAAHESDWGTFATSAKAGGSAVQGVTTHVNAAGSGLGSASYKLQAFGQLLDDMQYVGTQGLQPVINNIMQLSPALGIALIAGEQLYKNWGDLSAIFGGAATKSQAADMEELRKKTSLTADEAERLARITSTGQRVKELRAAPTEEQRKQDAAASKAIADAGFGNVARGLLTTNPALVDGQGEAMAQTQKIAELERKIAEAKALQIGGNGESDTVVSLREQLSAAKGGRAAARQRTAEDLVANGTLSDLFPGGLPQLREAVEKDPEAFGPKGKDLAQGLKGAEKTQDERDDDAAQEHFDKEAAASADHKARWDEQNRQKEEEEERRAQEHFDATARRNAEQKANWEAGGGDRKEVERDRTERRDRKLELARDQAPGVEGLIKEQLKNLLDGGYTALEAQRETVGQLKGRFGAETAANLVAGQVGGAQEELMSDFIKGPERRKSSVIGAEGLAESIQGAVGGNDEARQAREQRARQIDLLQRIADQRGGGRAMFGPDGTLGG